MSRLACLVTILFLVFGLTSPALALLGFVLPSDSRIPTLACSPQPRVKSSPPNLVRTSDHLCMTNFCFTDFPRTSKSHRSKHHKHGSNAGLITYYYCYYRLTMSFRSSSQNKFSLQRLVESFKIKAALQFKPCHQPHTHLYRAPDPCDV